MKYLTSIDRVRLKYPGLELRRRTPKRCPRCNVVQTLDNSGVSSRGAYLRYQAYCRACLVEKTRKRRLSIADKPMDPKTRLISYRVSAIYGRRNVDRFVAKGIDTDMTLSITSGVIESMLVDQAHRCNICTLPIEFTREFSLGQFSIDRIDNARGYWLDNVHITCFACNSARNSMTLDQIKAIMSGRPWVDYYTGGAIRRHMIVKRDTALSRTTDANDKLHVPSVNDLVDMVERQSRRCHYTGYPLRFFNKRVQKSDPSESMFYASIDRKNSSKGYTIDNVVVCCAFFNNFKNRAPYDEAVQRWAAVRAACS